MHYTALLYLIIFAIPFNGIRPFLNLGELSREGFFFATLIYMSALSPAVAMRLGRFNRQIFDLFKVQRAYIILIILSFFVHQGIIGSNTYGDRNGLERYIFSCVTFLYYFAFSCVVLFHAATIGHIKFLDIVSRAFVVLGVGLVLVSAFEIVSWFAGPAHAVLAGFRALFADSSGSAPFRLSGVSLEPSFNAFALLSCFPWALYRARLSGHLRYKLLAVLLILLCALSGARTAYIGLAAMLLGYVFYRRMFRQIFPAGWDGAVFVWIMFALGIAIPTMGFMDIAADSSTSNVTRIYLMKIAVESGIDPLWGQGFGQVAFYVMQQSSTIIQYSWELFDFYYGDRHGVLPPLFSWYARTFGEFGPIGYMVVGLAFSLVSKKVYCILVASSSDFVKRTTLIFFLLFAQFLAIANSIESVRVPQYWFTWIVAVVIIQVHRNSIKNAAK